MMMIIIILKSLLLMLCPATLGFEVMHFQEDNKLDNESYALRIGVPRELTSFTICARFQVHYFRESFSTILSVGTRENSDFMSLQIAKPTPGTDESTRIKFNQEDTGLRLTIEVFESVLLKWIHFCASLGFNEEGDKIVSVFIDGHKNLSVRHENFAPIPKDSCFVLGQDQDNFCGGFDGGQSFAGKLAQFKIWSEAVSDATILNQVDCNIQHDEVVADIINSISDLTVNRVNVSEYEKGDFCKENAMSWKRNILLPHDLPWIQSKIQCGIMGADMPQWRGDKMEQYDSFMALLREMDEDRGSDPDCVSITNGKEIALFLHIGLELNDEGIWYDMNTGEKHEDFSRFGFMSSSPAVKCGIYNAVEGLFYPTKKTYCEQVGFGCGLCVNEDNATMWFNLKGIPESLALAVDRVYFLHGLKNGRLHFRGVEKSELYFDSRDGKWYFNSFVTESAMLEVKTQNVHPFGRHETDAFESNFNFSFSRCADNEYTCNSGHCIALSLKCDSVMHCEDGSDEEICPIIRLPSTYKKNSPPILADDEGISRPVYVNVSVDIISIPSINTVEMTFTVNYFLRFAWHDNRLSMLDIHEVIFANEVDLEMKNKLWSPNVIFGNLFKLETFSIDDEAEVYVQKASEGEPTIIDGAESMLFDGATNVILLGRTFHHVFSCTFLLYFYPFDTQYCTMNVSSKNLGINQLQFVASEEASLLADKEMTEYRIKDIQLETGISRIGASQAYVGITFQRRMEYHVTNTFLQTQALIIVGFLSFFFRIDNFTDRIMVTLTVTLVMVTLMASIQGSLPKTSYFKLIDIWLLYCLVTLIITFIFHTLVGAASDGKKFLGFQSGLRMAENVNKLGKVIVTSFMIIVNIIFWTVAAREYAN